MTAPDEQPEAKRLLKIKLSEAEQKAVRVAAAIKDLSMSEFARQAVVAAARQAARDFTPEALELGDETPRPQRKSKT